MIETTEIEDTVIDAELKAAWEQVKGLTGESTARQIFTLGFLKGHVCGLNTGMRIFDEEMKRKRENS